MVGVLLEDLFRTLEACAPLVWVAARASWLTFLVLLVLEVAYHLPEVGSIFMAQCLTRRWIGRHRRPRVRGLITPDTFLLARCVTPTVESFVVSALMEAVNDPFVHSAMQSATGVLAVLYADNSSGMHITWRIIHVYLGAGIWKLYPL
jgi:hypothetical protein